MLSHLKDDPIFKGQRQNEDAVIELVDKIIIFAYQYKASDIHFDPCADHLLIRFRIDGIMQPVITLSSQFTPQITARLKVMSALDITERRLPQDGQLIVKINQISYSVRISILSTVYGEKIVLRLQNTQSSIFNSNLLTLGLTESQYHHFIAALHQPQGLILITGPTGSGKTRTLYSSIHQLITANKNICSVEDPVECIIEGINQTQVNNKIGLTFNCVLRALLRQDPDVIMVGEIRDTETAEIAISASLTGHLVLSTLHTNSAVEALSRLEDMGIKHYLLRASLSLITAQRLVRKLCQHCKKPLTKNHTLYPLKEQFAIHAWQAIGCEQCFNGYLDRIAVHELLIINQQEKLMLMNQSKNNSLIHFAQQHHHPSLFVNGLTMVNQGMTSLDELIRIIGLPQ